MRDGKLFRQNMKVTPTKKGMESIKIYLRKIWR